MQSRCRQRAVLLGLVFALLCAAAQSQGTSQSDTASGMPAASAAAGNEATLSTAPAAPDLASIEPIEHNVLHRPIELSDDLTHWVDRSYPYGSTQQGARPVHLGVEFVNPRGTQVYSAKAGVVVFAARTTRLWWGRSLTITV